MSEYDQQFWLNDPSTLVFDLPDIETAEQVLKQHPNKTLLFRNLQGFDVMHSIWYDIDVILSRLGLRSLNEFDQIIEQELEASPSIDFGLEALSIAVTHDPLPADLTQFPMFEDYPVNRGHYFNILVARVENLQGVGNLSVHRAMILDPTHLTLRVIPRDLKRMFDERASQNQDLPVALFMSVPYPVLLASAMTLRYGQDELEFATRMAKRMNQATAVVRTTNGLLIPAAAGIVIEGRLLRDQVAREGPYVDITRTIDLGSMSPVFAVERIWASKKFPCIHHLRSGESEHLMLMGFAKERSIIRNLTHHGVPVVDVYLTPQGFKWLQCLISLRSTEGLDLHRIKQLVCEVHHSIKQIIVFDQDVRLRDPALVQSALITRVRYETDLYLFPNERGSTLDPAYPGGYGCKLLVDATIPRERRTEEFQFQDV